MESWNSFSRAFSDGVCAESPAAVRRAAISSSRIPVIMAQTEAGWACLIYSPSDAGAIDSATSCLHCRGTELALFSRAFRRGCRRREPAAGRLECLQGHQHRLEGTHPRPGAFEPDCVGRSRLRDHRGVQQWKLLCLNRKTGAIQWERVAYQGVPKEKRHMKATYANATPATDGEIVVAFFGSQGLYAYDLDGKAIWSRDLGRFDVGAYDLPDYEWGTASSPIVYRDLVIVQCDQQKGSFLTALDRKTGKTVWRAERDELPSWGTPTIVSSKARDELVTNSSNFIRGYDPLTGKELWRLGGSSKITAPTPIAAGGLIVVASGRRPEAPIFAIRAGASGDITLAAEQTHNAAVAWSRTQRGPYMPTPLIYRG